MMTGLTIVLTAILWFVVPAVLCVGFFLWWRRLKHWSFAVLASATFLAALAPILSFLARNIARLGKTPDEVATSPDIEGLVQVSLVLYVVMGVLLLVGAFGLIAAARDDFLLDDAKVNATEKE